MERKIRYQQEFDPEWAHRVGQLPGGERLFSCIQCGTCSGTCPLSIYMDLTPRRIISLVREGFRTDALRSQTIWLCTSCYSCAVHCPQQINLTDVMYNLKGEAIRYRLYPRRFPIPVLAQEFCELVRRRGRNAEFWLVLRLALRSDPRILLPMLGTGWRLWRTGRLSLRRERIRAAHELHRALTPPQEVS
jgi:heterodisulfide reductase subunit C